MLGSQAILLAAGLGAWLIPGCVGESLPSVQDRQSALWVKLNAYSALPIAKSLVWKKCAVGQCLCSVGNVKATAVKLNRVEVLRHKVSPVGKGMYRVKAKFLDSFDVWRYLSSQYVGQQLSAQAKAQQRNLPVKACFHPAGFIKQIAKLIHLIHVGCTAQHDNARCIRAKRFQGIAGKGASPFKGKAFAPKKGTGQIIVGLIMVFYQYNFCRHGVPLVLGML
tara:strand:- start:570 stop:1235 length:666 start_codon:yes stop_codon:yes gene_type:complete